MTNKGEKDMGESKKKRTKEFWRYQKKSKNTPSFNNALDYSVKQHAGQQKTTVGSTKKKKNHERLPNKGKSQSGKTGGSSNNNP